jgi:hypothetical protein
MVNLRRFRLARSPTKVNPHATPARRVPLFPSTKKAVKRKPLSTPSPGPKKKRQKTSSTSNNWLSSLPDLPDTSRATSIDNSSTPDPSRDPSSNMRTRMNKKKVKFYKLLFFNSNFSGYKRTRPLPCLWKLSGPFHQLSRVPTTFPFFLFVC